jgi:hypothetical protein
LHDEFACNLRYLRTVRAIFSPPTDLGVRSTGGSRPIRRSLEWGTIPWLNRLDRRNRNALEMLVDSLRFPIKLMHSDRLLR